ncbi:hypothetical protein EV284_6438 [Streptomyces sp. BK022]|uniref:hypothetical protein n=1 Tax=Streptomyces sp. BK022 TaxID=2512123 RepID=UPI001029F57C|nr:hypothetical protein [Streptomyces sp. BK022]RZU28272.1 hypothetical protein EV284_6438 [Streptomyces sp. BK022]
MAAGTRRPRRDRDDRQEDRETLPGIAEVRLRADENTAKVVMDVLRANFTVTRARDYPGDRWYFALDTGNTALDLDGPETPS